MNTEFFDRAADFLPDECFKAPPDLAVVLGSGWGDALAKDEILCRLPYSDIPGMGGTTVSGHSGEFILYRYCGKRIAAFSGRRHWYEGVGWETVVLPIEQMSFVLTGVLGVLLLKEKMGPLKIAAVLCGAAAVLLLSR